MKIDMGIQIYMFTLHINTLISVCIYAQTDINICACIYIYIYVYICIYLYISICI